MQITFLGKKVEETPTVLTHIEEKEKMKPHSDYFDCFEHSIYISNWRDVGVTYTQFTY